MNKEELTQQVAEDFLQVKHYTDLRTETLRDLVWRKGQRHICDNWKSKNGNVWTWMLDIEGEDQAMMTFFTTINTDNGLFVFKPQVTPQGFILIVYLPHFFKRYRERMKLGPKLKTLQVMIVSVGHMNHRNGPMQP